VVLFGKKASELRSLPAFVADAPEPDQALWRLIEGNAAFIEGRAAPINSREHLKKLAAAQHPFAVIVGCADSRVSAQTLFNQKLGQLFVVRVAGNTVDRVALGSIAYGVSVLGCSLVVVPGHARCGAVSAAVDMVENGTDYQGAIAEMVLPIVPAVIAAKTHEPHDLIDASVRENIRRVADGLRSAEPVITSALEAGTVRIVGAHYDLETGEVEFFT
jgi:carbonic anhydrase